ncbi:MAG: ubiquinol-cytochrome C reductase [Rhodospirillaceae bacterium]|nr:ubiquinol-cytochrome C reductase [Rhodospirillaceae bacterium]|tara:strand:+ start:1950 stop:2372 length:423 start_codon:yes stop_codon:yes gene_type:complete
MQYWLFKSEPGAWSWDDQVKDGTTEWDGVRNHQANNNMKSMSVGDKGFFYHSVTEKKIVGVVEIVKEHYPDFTDETGRFGMVDVKSLYPVNYPVTLAEIKKEPELQNFALIKQSRLSVVPVSENEWKILCKLCGISPAQK